MARIRRLTALEIPALGGRVPYEHVKGYTPDISPDALFSFYQPVWVYTSQKGFPDAKKEMAMWLGPDEHCIDVMGYHVIVGTGKVITRKDVWAVSEAELRDDLTQERLTNLRTAINAKIGDSLPEDEIDPEVCLEHDIPEGLFEGDEYADEPFDETATRPEADDYTPEAYDQYLMAQVQLPRGGESQHATVKARKRGPDGNPIGKRNSNPLLDTREYEVEFADGTTDSYTANQIAQNLYSQVDDAGNVYTIIDEIVDHKKDGHAVAIDDGFITPRHGEKKRHHTTKGWKLLVTCKGGESTWVALKDLKDSNPVQVAEYAVANKLAEEPAFAWWIRPVLRKRDRIIKKVKKRYWKRSHKYGVELPHDVASALKIDRETGTDFWRQAIEKEMKNVLPAFEFNDKNEEPVGYKWIKCHMVFDIKTDLTRKARLVAGGHMMEEPKESVYSSIVSRDSIRIAFLIAALNDLEVLSGDIQNAYLNAKTTERVWTTAGLEFGSENVGRPVKIVRALYGLRSSGKCWREHMAAMLTQAGFKSCKADNDVWMRPALKPDGAKYYEYVLCYVDDILVISMKPKEVMDYLESAYTLKEGSVGVPTEYLGAQVRQVHIEGSADPTKVRWGLSSDLYVKRAVAEVERELEKVNKSLRTGKISTALASGYRGELDTTPELDPPRANYYQGLIGVLHWVCELGRIDIVEPTSKLSSFLMSPREGHLEQVFHIFAYLKKYDRSTMVFDDTEPYFDESRFQKVDWQGYYPGAKEAEHPNAPEACGKAVTMSCFVDADHAGCQVTRRLHSGILLFLNRAPILWFSKRQNSVETSTFGSEFVAMKIASEMIEGMRHKLVLMGMPIDGPANVFCDNESVVKNSSQPESTLKKKSNAVAYHRVREAQAAGIMRIAWETGKFELGGSSNEATARAAFKRIMRPYFVVRDYKI